MESCNVEDADVYSMVKDRNGEDGCNEDFDDVCDVGSADTVSDEDALDYGNVIRLSDQQIMRKVFRSEERAYEFYYKFGRCHGFGVRKGDFGKDDDGNLIQRRFFCNRAGLRDEKHLHRLDRQRGHWPETRTNCMAKLSIYLDKENSIARGYSLLGFTKKDAYNYIDKMHRSKIADGDSNAAIVYLEGKAAADPIAMARYNLTEDGMLANMFWADGISRVDY
ncbi:uncharacterized protein LOC130966630 [Arachis stenosperma]|uniref:uncharacterized protein LOC130966630 n=1 Tax=Arachis stenosperma TaxID=217475 RepID=UPI0025AD230A|nr:uncharacterized protein LOC130966630 [Arachis stenosperma]